MRKYLVAIGTISLLSLSACGSGEETEENTEAEASGNDEKEIEAEGSEDEEPETHDIDLESEWAMDGNSIEIDGETNFKDGTKLTYHVSNLDDEDEEDVKVGTVDVEDGSFNADIDIGNFSDGEIELLFGYLPGPQSDDVLGTYGQQSEYIESDDIINGELMYEDFFMNTTPTEVNGEGDDVSENFNLQSGFAIIDAEHSGERNFIVELNNESGGQELIVNTIGIYEGESLAVIPQEGEYHLDVDADGSWEAEVSQELPDTEDIYSEDDHIEGSGDSVVFVDMQSGNKRIDLTHTGERNFIVTLNGQDLLVNDIGPYEGAQSQSFDSGEHIFQIEADGDWTLEIE
ncbi:hypothetical protein [Natribacillus halophilus]|uniref:Uncharacterized protein n=1 Tax=Natribacillus halophilus TaxID=549003 RepID=A0A1G8NV06_9BACI|nr:hypothetical protein [Natribacillus halophilus]SDI83786.1 hypothetical protein SAMN04488123_10736 [Natribacillus halophilus]